MTFLKQIVSVNSFTGRKDPSAANGGGNTVTWYICGPRLYDSAHVGHASYYVRFGEVQHILSDYFAYHVQVQMNVTGIDDNIIHSVKFHLIHWQNNLNLNV